MPGFPWKVIAGSDCITTQLCYESMSATCAETHVPPRDNAREWSERRTQLAPFFSTRLMLKDEDIIISRGRAVGGDFMTITHLPTGICRGKGPPLGSGKAVHDFTRQARHEIEAELNSKGLTQYLLPSIVNVDALHRSNRTRRPARKHDA